MNKYFNIVKRGLFYSFITGSCSCLIPNEINIQYNKKKLNKIALPIIGGFLGAFGFLLLPLSIINYFSNGSYYDKLYDKYDIHVKRYHQHDENNKYGYPSIIMIEINKK